MPGLLGKIVQRLEQILSRAAALLKNCSQVMVNLLVTRKHSYCPLLFESVFISPDGSVFTCCGWKPGTFGNINTDTLSRIWNGSARLKLYRMLSRHRCLPCFFDCNILSRSQKSAPCPSLTEHAKHPGTVWLLYGEICNLNCIMCPQDHSSRVTLDNAVLKRNIDWSSVDEIEMQGGEILAMENAKKLYLWLTKECRKKVNMITNGVFVDDRWAHHLVTGSDWIQISVNAATKVTHELVNRNSRFEKVLQGIEKLVALKQELNLSTRIIYKYTMVPENVSEVADAIRLADKLGCDEIHFGYDHTVIGYMNDEIRSRLNNEITRLLDGTCTIVIERNRLEHLGLIN